MISRTAITGAAHLCNVVSRSAVSKSRVPSMTFTRRLTQSRSLFQEEKSVVGAKTDPEPTLTETQTAAHGYGPGFHHYPSEWDKKLLVWTGIYQNTADVPSSISTTQMKRGRDWFRIRMNIVMLILTILGSAVMIKSGRRDMEAGHNLSNENREWHRKNREEHKAQQAAANNNS
ncbi:hypothetical protein ScPMuIL_013223 [Solemya velum]